MKKSAELPNELEVRGEALLGGRGYLERPQEHFWDADQILLDPDVDCKSWSL